MDYSRRNFVRMLTGIPIEAVLAKRAAAQRTINSTINGVRLGAQSYSFRDLTLDKCIEAMAQIGLGECELFQNHVEDSGVAKLRASVRPSPDPAGAMSPRQLLRYWRLNVSLDEFKEVRRKFDAAGVGLAAYNLSFKDDFTDEEIDRGFQMAQALGVPMITASSTVTVAKRLVPFVEKYKMTVAFHGHSDVRDPNQFAKPESFAQALAMSKRFMVNLDIGHFVAANYDPIEYIEKNHDRIVILHLKDRKRNQGDNTPWGQGDTPIKQVLQLLKTRKYPIRAFIEYEYRGTESSTAEVRKCFQYCKDALA
jgi:sugar phosphate isomerase/epimerase